MRSRAILQQDDASRRLMLLACLVGMFSTTFPATILTISVKPIALSLHSLPTTITWVTTAPLLAAAVTTPLLGRLGDLRGHRRLFLTGLTVSITFSLLTAMAWNAMSLILFRTASQIGAAATVPSTFAMLFRTFPASERVKASSLASGTLAGAAVVGVVVGGPLVDTVGWRSIFVIQVAICVGALVLALIALPADKSQSDRQPVDLPGATMLALSTLLVTFGINRLGVWGLNIVTGTSLALAPVAVGILVYVERRARSPILPVRVLRSGNTRLISGATFLLGAGYMGNFIITPLLLQSVFGLSTGMTSLVTVPRAIFIMVAAPSAGRFGMRWGERRIILWACAALTVVVVVMAFGASTKSLTVLVVTLPLTGWAWGHAQPSLVAAMGHTVRKEDLGLGTALQQTSNQIGQVVGIGLFTALAANATTPGPFVLVYLLTALCSLLAGVVAYFIREQARHSLTVAASQLDVRTDTGLSTSRLSSSPAVGPQSPIDTTQSAGAIDG
jgi:MFS family permease